MGLRVDEVVSARAMWEALRDGLTGGCLARVSARTGTLNGGGSSTQRAGSDEEGQFCGGKRRDWVARGHGGGCVRRARRYQPMAAAAAAAG